MTDQQTPQSSLGGIAPPSDQPLSVVPPPPPKQEEKKPPEIGQGLARALLGSFLFIGAFYVIAGLILMAMFPRPDGSYDTLKQLATTAFPAGGIVWLLLGVFGALRISSIKDKNRLRFFAGIRLAAYIFPLLVISIATPLLINVEPSLSLQISEPLTASDLIAPVSVTFGMPVAQKYFATQHLTPLKYEWDFNGDGSVDQETFDPESVFVYERSGIYSVAARVTMTNGEVKQLFLRVVIPRASFGVLPLQPVIEEPVTFTLANLLPNTQGAPTLARAKWDFDADGVVDLETDKLSVSTTYHKLGPVTVSVVVSLSNQTQTTYQRTITIVKPQEQPYPITLETEPVTLLGPPPFGVLFTLKTKEPIASANWDFGNDKTAEGLRVAQVFNTIGTYTVSVNARSQSGAIAKLTKVVRVTNPLNIPDLNFEGATSVRNFSIEGQVPLFIDITPVTSQPLVSFSWDAPNAPESTITDKTFQATYRDVGSYFIDLIGIDPDQNVFRKRIKITALPPQSFVNFSMDPETPTAPALVTFDGSDTFVPTEEITGFEWDFGDGNSNTTKFSGARKDHLYEKPGTYVITLTVRTTAGKVYSSNKTLLVRAPVLDACFLPSRRSGQAPLGVRFETDCSTGTFATWLWDFGDDAQSDEQNPTHVFMKSGEYKVTLTGTTSDGLKSTKTTTISVSQ